MHFRVLDVETYMNQTKVAQPILLHMSCISVDDNVI